MGLWDAVAAVLFGHPCGSRVGGADGLFNAPVKHDRNAGRAALVEMSLELRVAVCDDEPFLREMLYLALYVPPGVPQLPRSVLNDPLISRYVDGWGRCPGDRGLIGLSDGVPIGAAWLRLFPASDPGYGFVNESTPELSVAVLPEYRGRGVGSALVQELVRDAPAVSLSCDPRNPAWKLYVRLGFVPLRDGRTMVRRVGGLTPSDCSNRL